MKISEMIEKLDLTLVTKEPSDREITGCYIGDLLSWVMGKANSGDVWITIMNNINIVAVASLTDVACILLCECVSVSPEIIEKANSEGITILSSDKTAFAIAKEIGGDL